MVITYCTFGFIVAAAVVVVVAIYTYT